jgi:hypothetical protein
LALMRPDLSHTMQQVCLFMHDPREVHLPLIKRILKYVKQTAHLGLQLHAGSSSELVAYSDVDWAGCPDTRKSTSGFCIFLGTNLVSWSSKRHHTVSRSSAEGEYRAVANSLLNLSGSINYFLSLINQRPKQLLCTVLTSAPHTFQLIMCNINKQSMSRLICTLSVIVLPSEKLAFFMCLAAHSLLIFSPKDCPLLCFRICVPV